MHAFFSNVATAFLIKRVSFDIEAVATSLVKLIFIVFNPAAAPLIKQVSIFVKQVAAPCPENQFIFSNASATLLIKGLQILLRLQPPLSQREISMFRIGQPLLLERDSLLLCNLAATPFTKRIFIQPVASAAAPIQRVFSHFLPSAAAPLVADNLYFT
jgi:hypothetical protein